jgi:signal peptidase II
LNLRLRDAAWALATCGVVVAIDQASKALVRDNVGRGETVEVLPFLDIANTRNKGVAFGLAGDVSPLLIGGTLLVLLALLGYLATRARAGWAIWLPAGLLIGGALGNLADRVRDGSVTDFIDFPLWATFNLADVAIVVGVGLLVFLPDRDQDP